MIGEKLKELRIANNFTQSDIEKKIDISQKTISKYERNLVDVSTEVLVKLAKLFNVSVDYLLGLEDDFGVKQYNGTQSAPLTWDKKELLELYDLLPDERKEMLLYTAKDYVDICKQRGLINSGRFSFL